MGNRNSNRSMQQNASLMEYFPSPSPSPGMPMHAPLIEENELEEEREMVHTESVTSIHDEMAEILNMVSRIIVNYIKIGQRAAKNPASEAFNESQFLKKKWVNIIYSHPCDLLPYFAYEQIQLHPETNFPNFTVIADFIRPIFNKLGIQNECLLMMLIYIERIISEADIKLIKENWRPIVYTALLLSGKMQEDLTITNNDFTQIYPFFSLNSTNFLEKQFTSVLSWNLYISHEQYAKYLHKLQGMIKTGEHSLLLKLSSRQDSLREVIRG